MTREKAIETVRRCCPRISDSKCDFESAMRVLVPELAESEDERTKRMLNTITYKMSQHQPDIFTEEENEWFNAYLEKQKESLHVSESCKEKVDSFTDEDERIRKELIEQVGYILPDKEEYNDEGNVLPTYHKRIERYRAYLEMQKPSFRQIHDGIMWDRGLRTGIELGKQKEQKPAESVSQLTVQGKGVYKICPHCKERMIRDDSKVYTSMPPQYGYTCPKCGTMEFDTVMYDNPEMKEQKPVLTAKEAWKEMRFEVYAQASGNRHQPNCSYDFTKMFSLYDIDEIIEKIGDSIVGQKPVEWSEEDDEMVEEIKHIVFGAGSVRNGMRGKIHNWLYNRLKYLCPAKQEWSEEDEKTIDDACCWLGEYAGYIGGKNYAKSSMLFGLVNRLDALKPQKLDVSKLENFDPVDVLNRIKEEWPMAWEKVVGKQEWSDADEKVRLACINTINEVIDYELNRLEDCTYRPVTNYDEQINFLESLHERFNLQPKNEWNEEDEENFKWFDKLFRAESVVIGGKDIPQDKYLWFKSLRPQPKRNCKDCAMFLNGECTKPCRKPTQSEEQRISGCAETEPNSDENTQAKGVITGVNGVPCTSENQSVDWAGSEKWNEEDENTLKCLHKLVARCYTEKFIDAQTAHDMRVWINKHLRPDTFQNGNSRPKSSDNWKPSDE